MNELTINQNQLENVFNKIESFSLKLIYKDISYKDFDFKEWSNHLLKIKLDGNFPIKIGNALSYKKQKVTYDGILLGADISSRIFSILDKNGQNSVYIPFDGKMEVWEYQNENNI